MSDLQQYVEQLRQQKPNCTVPNFDPNGPLEKAKVMFLLMKPGTRGAGETNIVSLTSNNDQTAKNTRDLFVEAGLGFHDVLLWNVCPWYDGKRNATAQELDDGLNALNSLLPLLPSLETVVLVGNKAHAAGPILMVKGLRVLKTAHPSPMVKNINPALYAKIAPEWARVK